MTIRSLPSGVVVGAASTLPIETASGLVMCGDAARRAATRRLGLGIVKTYRRRMAVAAVLVGAAGLGACSAAQPAPTPAPSSSAAEASTPADGVTLRDLGFRNAPEGFSVPKGLSVEQVVDQPNVVTIVSSGPVAHEIAPYLRANLAGMGFTLTGDAEGSLVFHDSVWDGALTSANELVGLTLRRKA